MKTSGIDYPEPIFAGENKEEGKMRTRLAGFVFVLVFIMAMTYSGFMVWAQETTGQTAELPPTPAPTPYSYGVRQRPQKPPVARLVAIRAGR